MMTFDQSLQKSLETLHALRTIRPAIDAAGDLILETLKTGNKLIACGNGGSAAEAQHLTTELVGRYRSNRRSLPAVALTSDGTLMSCIGNDFGWDQVFVRQFEGIATEGDLLVCLSSSGQSRDLVTVLETARKHGIHSLALLGKGGGACQGLATIEVIIPSDQTASVQEAHLFLIHHFCERIEGAFPA
ncbi:MAG: SIS domain-containing protein [Opitutaceae bacterium]